MQATALMQKYVGTVNQSIDRHRDEAPYKQMIELSRPMAEGIEMRVGIYKDDASSPHDYFTLEWTGSELRIAGHGRSDDADLAWKVPQAHLEQVVRDPKTFLENPARLDLDWLTRRIGLA